MGYTKKTQLDSPDPKVVIDGIAVSGNQAEVFEAPPIGNTSVGGTKDGDNPSMPSEVAFGSGKDMRNYPANGGAKIAIYKEIGIKI